MPVLADEPELALISLKAIAYKNSHGPISYIGQVAHIGPPCTQWASHETAAWDHTASGMAAKVGPQLVRIGR